jgi:hypothetical protein
VVARQPEQAVITAIIYTALGNAGVRPERHQATVDRAEGCANGVRCPLSFVLFPVDGQRGDKLMYRSEMD